MACKTCNSCTDLGCKNIVYPECIVTKVAYPCINVAAGKTGTVLFNAIDTAICTLKTSITTINNTITNIQTDITNIDTNITTIDDTVINVQNDLYSLTTIVEDATGCLYDASGNCEIENLQLSITNIEGDITTIETNITTLQSCVLDASGNCFADEDWRNVGDPGEPGFNSTLSQLTPGSGINLSFRLNKDNRLAIRGGFDVDANLATGNSIFTLPVGYRPNALTVILGVVEDTADLVQLSISNAGDVFIKGPIGVLVSSPNIIRIPEYVLSLD